MILWFDRKQNVLTKPLTDPKPILFEHEQDHHNAVDFDQRPKEEPAHPSGTVSSMREVDKPVKHEISHTSGFARHSILLMSDEELGSTPISVLMSQYGEADGGGSCAGDFGNELVNRWRKTKARTCGGTDADLASVKSSNPNKLATSLDCHLVQQTRHHGGGDQLCLYQNVMVNMALFNDETLTTKVVKEYVQTMHAKQPYIQFPKGFIQGMLFLCWIYY